MRVYRLHIRPSGGLGDPVFSFAHCLKEKALGVGWGIPARSRALTWEAYEKTGSKTYGSLRAISGNYPLSPSPSPAVWETRRLAAESSANRTSTDGR